MSDGIRRARRTINRTVGGPSRHWGCRRFGLSLPRLILLLAVASGCQPRVDRVGVIVRRNNQALMNLRGGHLGVRHREDAPVEPADAASLLPEDELTIEAARRLAVRANPDIHAAQARLMTATSQIEEAMSRFRPTLSTSYSGARTFHTPASQNRLSALLQIPTTSTNTFDTGNPTVTAIVNALRRPFLGGRSGLKPNTSPFSEHTTSFTGAWVVFDGYVRDAQLLAAKYVRSASADAYHDAERLLIQAVDSAYFRVQLAEERLRIARADNTFSIEQLEETRKLMLASRATQSDVNNFRVRALAAQANVTAAIGERDLGRVMLAGLMGLPSSNLPPALSLSPLTPETETEMAAPNVQEWIDRAMAQRPDVRQFQALLESERQNVLAAKGLFLPTVSISGTWGFDRASNLHYSVADQSSAGAVDVRWDLYTGGARTARVRAAEAVLTEAQANLNRAKLDVHSDVRSAVIAIVDIQGQIRLQRENLTTSLENRRIISAAYLAGRKPLTRLNESQRDYITADADLALARIQLRQAWSDLHAAAAMDPEADPRGAEPQDTGVSKPEPDTSGH